CKDVHIRFFVGGAEGDAFGTIVYNGAKQAAADLGPKVDYIFSQWDAEKMVQQLREAVAVKPQGIAMMGHPGDAAIMPLAEEAHKDGIKMMYQNVPVPKVTAAFGGGYVGAQQEQQGRALGAEAFKLGKLKAGDKAIMIGPFENENRGARERGTVAALKEAGVEVIQLSSPPSGEW
ncbi:MAG: sugar ABC transporter substrate-binding protein, partial [Mesorhizobium sp.]